MAKGLDDVTLVLDDLTLTSSASAPIVVKKGTSATIHVENTVTLTDSEDPDNENSTDETVADAFEGAAIKVKSGSSVTFCGSGTLNVNGNAKNGIKGGATASFVFYDYRTVYNINASNNGIASDGSIVVYGGTFDIDADNDGIKSTPDATDETKGTTVDTESAGTVTIYGGTFDIDVDGDGIQADTNLSIYNGAFDIKTLSGYNTKGTKYNTNGHTSSSYIFDPDTMSCKGLKASGDRAEEVGTESVLYVSGGTFSLNTADDALHSDGYTTVTGGTSNIYAGDDGMHADTSLTLGEEGSDMERDPDVTINASYEGLEGGTVYMYQGRYYVVEKDDGVNAAGDSGSGDNFSPGSSPGKPGQQGGATSTGNSDYNIYIKGGNLYVYCDGDGLDSNGGLYLTGGMIEVFSQSSGDNSAIDADGTVSIDGATIFTAGINSQMDPVQASWFGSSQKYKTLSSKLSSGKVVNVTLSNTVLYSTKLTKAASFFMYSAPGLSETPALATASSVTSDKAVSWSHSWDSGAITTFATETSTGLMNYTCTSCNETEAQTIPITYAYTCGDTHEVAETEDEGYTVTFTTDDGVKQIDVYYTQDYTSADEENVSSAVSRDSSSGDPCSTGDGQVNFLVQLNDGYTISSVSVTDGTYKNIKAQGDNIYRITKITGDVTVTITSKGKTDKTDISTASVTINTYTYTGNEILPEAKVVYDETTLTADEDYTVEAVDGEEYVKPGYKEIRIAGTGKYTGTIDSEFLIQFADYTDSSLPYYDYIYWMLREDYTTGWKDGTFRPMYTINRAAVVTFLWRMAGEPEASEIAGFSDMPEDTEANQDFRKAISWASEKGITTGWKDIPSVSGTPAAG